jgi:GNAT superfamily N-acetyltransferase
MEYEYKVTKVVEASDFWALLDALVDDGSGFVNNRIALLDAFKNGDLYGMRVVETDEMYQNGQRRDPLFLEETFYMLPCLCVLDDDDKEAVRVLWTHSRARRRGIGRAFVTQLGLKKAMSPLPGSEAFWDACGVKQIKWSRALDGTWAWIG